MRRPYVTRVLQRYQRDGADAILHRGKPGRKPALDARTLARARQLRVRGRSIREIAKAIGAAYSTLVGALKGVKPGALDRPPQPELTGVDAVSTADDAERSSVDGVAVDADGDQVVPRVDDDALGGDDGAAANVDVVVVAGSEPSSVMVIPSASASEADSRAVEHTSETALQGVAAAEDDMAEDDMAEELRPGALLAPDGAPHQSRYAGTLLAIGALRVLGLESAMARATIQRSRVATYSATQALTALSAAWAAGFGSIEALHERDPRALGVVMGLERSPSVRTLWRAIDQMTERDDPVQWWAGWMVSLMANCPPELPVWGVDGHFKACAGDEPIDKG